MTIRNGGTTCIRCNIELGVDAHPLRSYCKKCYKRKRSVYMRIRYLELTPKPREKCERCNFIRPRNHTRYCTRTCSLNAQKDNQRRRREESKQRARDGFGQTMMVTVND